MTEFDERPRTSPITGLRPLGSVLASSIGTQPGGPGSAVALTSEEEDAAAMALVDRTAEANDASLLDGLTRLLGSPPVERKKHLISEEHGYYEVSEGFDVGKPSAETVMEARGLLAKANARLPDSEIAKEVAKTMAVTKARAGNSSDQQLFVEVMIEELQDFPADVMRDAFRRYRRQETFSPSLAEIVEFCHTSSQRRRTLNKAFGMRTRYGND